MIMPFPLRVPVIGVFNTAQIISNLKKMRMQTFFGDLEFNAYRRNIAKVPATLQVSVFPMRCYCRHFVLSLLVCIFMSFKCYFITYSCLSTIGCIHPLPLTSCSRCHILYHLASLSSSVFAFSN